MSRVSIQVQSNLLSSSFCNKQTNSSDVTNGVTFIPGYLLRFKAYLIVSNPSNSNFRFRLPPPLLNLKVPELNDDGSLNIVELRPRHPWETDKRMPAPLQVGEVQVVWYTHFTFFCFQFLYNLLFIQYIWFFSLTHWTKTEKRTSTCTLLRCSKNP